MLKNLKIGTKLISTFLILALIAGVVGAIGIYYTNEVGMEGENIGVKLAPLGDAAMEVKLTATQAHLIFEEIMAGDDSEDINTVWGLLDETLWFAGAILNGGKNDEGEFFASTDSKVRSKVEELIPQIKSFIEAARTRYGNLNLAGIGSEIDQSFDEAYEDLQAGLSEIIATHKGTPEKIEIVHKAGGAKYLLANGHLFLEEFLSGDDSVKLDDILENFNTAKAYIAELEEEVALTDKINAFINLTQKRAATQSNTDAAGSESDVQFDAAFEKFIALADEAEEFVHESMVEGELVLHKRIGQSRIILMMIAVVAVALAVALGITITRSIAGPLRKSVELAEFIGNGDLTQSLDIDRGDEIGVLAKTLNIMVSNLGKMFKEITEGVETLSSSSTELSAISQQMSSGAEQTSGKSNTVATASEEMSSNMNTVAVAVEQAATNTNMIASSAEQMAATINEIAQNSEKARSITGGAVSQAKNSASRVGELGQGAKEISKVTETITEISEQTNLLALNATIEAARAGEAGKGFAVVANEIKELAKQTAEATGEIKNRIEGIQNSISGTITDIEQVPQVINDVNEIVSTIATAVEEQSVTTKEIAENVAQASKGIQEVTENVTQSTSVAGEIAKDISEVNQAASEMANSSAQVDMSAGELSRLSEQLKGIVGRFKV